MSEEEIVLYIKNIEKINAAINEIHDKLKKLKLDKLEESIIYKDLKVIELLKEGVDSFSSFNAFKELFYESIDEVFVDNPIREHNESFYDSMQQYKFMVYAKLLFCSLHYGRQKKPDKIIFIDEGQDLSLNEYRVLKEICDSDVVFNIFGDINQLIKIGRGISDWDMLYKIADIYFYSLNENYRNTRRITKFCNDQFTFKAVPIGPDGNNIRTISKIQMIQELRIKSILGERLAIIAKNISDLDFVFEELAPDSKVKSIPITLLDVEGAKGLEFDIVYVQTTNMSTNEKYIAFTRALSELAIVQ